jgi:hypothetical protein
MSDRAKGFWLALVVALLLGVIMPTLDAHGAMLEHFRGVRADGAAFNCWNVRRSPLLQFCVFYPTASLARR